MNSLRGMKLIEENEFIEIAIRVEDKGHTAKARIIVVCKPDCDAILDDKSEELEEVEIDEVEIKIALNPVHPS
jgi:hypothetical protein